MISKIMQLIPHRHQWIEIDAPPHHGNYEFIMCTKCGAVDAI